MNDFPLAVNLSKNECEKAGWLIVLPHEREASLYEGRFFVQNRKFEFGKGKRTHLVCCVISFFVTVERRLPTL